MQTKKVVSVLLAGVTTLSMAMPVLAANGDPNLVVTPDTKYSTPIQANSSVTLGLMPANAYYQRTGFDSDTDAAKGLKVSKINLGEDKISTDFAYGSKTVDGLYAGTVTVKGKKGQYGPASLHIVNENNTSAGSDMTVYVEAAETQKDVTVSKVQVKDLSGDNVITEDEQNLSVSAAAKKTSNPFNGSEGAAQSYPTAGDALYSLAEAEGMSFEQNEGYVQSVTDKGENTLEAYTTEDWTYYGWNYCVVRNGKKVAEGDILSASVLEVEEGDSVYWAFGTMDQANEYFNGLK
mgnify:FL=1